MVKGVNRTVIEVHNTGSKYFEKIVFYVTPEYGNLPAKQLEQESAGMLPRLSQPAEKVPVTGLRKRCRKKRNRRIVLAAALCAGAVAAVAAVLLLF